MCMIGGLCVVFKELNAFRFTSTEVAIAEKLTLAIVFDAVVALVLYYTVRLFVQSITTKGEARWRRFSSACAVCVALISAPFFFDSKEALAVLVAPLLVLSFPFGLQALFTADGTFSCSWLLSVWSLYILMILLGIRWKSRIVLGLLLLVWVANAAGCGRVIHWSTGSSAPFP